MRKIKLFAATISILVCGSFAAFALIPTSATGNADNSIIIRKIIDCPDCEGTGKLGIKKKCVACQGEGCSLCDYRGYTKTYGSQPCSTCKGTGKVKTEP